MHQTPCHQNENTRGDCRLKYMTNDREEVRVSNKVEVGGVGCDMCRLQQAAETKVKHRALHEIFCRIES